MELELKNVYIELCAILIFTRTAEMKLQATYFYFFAELALMLAKMCKFKREMNIRRLETSPRNLLK